MSPERDFPLPEAYSYVSYPKIDDILMSFIVIVSAVLMADIIILCVTFINNPWKSVKSVKIRG